MREIYILRIIVTGCLFLPLLAQGSANLRPAWAQKSLTEIPTNASFIGLGVGSPSVNSSSRNDLIDLNMDKKTAGETRQRYDDMVRNYEMRKTYGLTDTQEEIDHTVQVGGMAKTVIRQFGDTQLRNNLKGAQKNAMKDENLRKAAKPIAIATAMAAAATGAPVSVRIGGQTELRSTTDVREQTGQFQVLSPGLRGGVDVAAKNPDRVRETAAPGERYRVSVWKELPFLDLTSGLTYGTTTTGLTTSLSKELAENVTCVLDSTRPLRKSPLPSHEETVRLLYGISF